MSRLDDRIVRGVKLLTQRSTYFQAPSWVAVVEESGSVLEEVESGFDKGSFPPHVSSRESYNSGSSAVLFGRSALW